MKWANHILEHEESLVRSLNSRLGALKKVSKVASFRNRKIIANGVFLSKLKYLYGMVIPRNWSRHSRLPRIRQPWQSLNLTGTPQQQSILSNVAGSMYSS
jgi:hypothetical protein